jgi:hypothetical protein
MINHRITGYLDCNEFHKCTFYFDRTTDNHIEITANITADVETDVTLVCEVISDPRALIVWQYIDMQGNVVEIKRTSDGLDGYYVISNARLKDSGKYVCNVSNTYGYDSYVTDVLIKPSKLE